MNAQIRSVRRFAAVASTVIFLGSVTRAALPAGNVVQQWNKIAEDTVLASGAFQNEGLLYMAYVSAAVYDAVVAIEGRYEPYAAEIDAQAGASVEAAVIEAAYRTLRYYFPLQAGTLDARYAEALALVPNGPFKERGQQVGFAAYSQIVLLRANDGRLTPIGTSSPVDLGNPRPGLWQPTPPAFQAPQTPWVGDVQPFVLHNVQQFHPGPPPPLNSHRWEVALDEVREYGEVGSTVRTDEQTAIARFWTANVIRQYNLLGRELATTRTLDLVETARLLALINIVGVDAQIAVMHWKYAYLFWRPVTSINYLEPGANWLPLITTPNHPEYPGAHGSLTGAIAEILTEFFGTDLIDVDIVGLPTLTAVRHFDTAEQLVDEIVDARLWGGLHYRFSTEAGVQLGRKVAHFDLTHAFQPERGKRKLSAR